MMVVVIFYAMHDYVVYQENMHICNSHNLCLLYMNSSILRKYCTKYVNKVRLVKEHVCKIQDNLHHMTWYTRTCDIMTMDLLYMLTL